MRGDSSTRPYLDFVANHNRVRAQSASASTVIILAHAMVGRAGLWRALKFNAPLPAAAHHLGLVGIGTLTAPEAHGLEYGRHVASLGNSTR